MPQIVAYVRVKSTTFPDNLDGEHKENSANYGEKAL